MKKIIFVIPSLGGGGAERVFATLLSEISLDEFEVILAIGINEGPFLSLVPKNIRIVELGGCKKSSRSFMPLLRLIYKVKPDIVFSTLGMVSTSALCSLFIGRKTRFIARFGNTLSADLDRAKRESFLRYVLQKLSYKLVLLNSEIIAQSDYMKRDIVEYFSYKKSNLIHVIHNPAPSPTLTSKNHTDNEYTKLVTVGRFAWQKGYDILLEALKKVIDRGYKIDFSFIGDGIDKQLLVGIVNRLGINTSISFLGFKNEPFQFAKDADIFISSSRFEGFSNVIVESLANGIPVVATDCPSGNREIIIEGENGWLASVEGDRVENLANTIILAINSRNAIDMISESKKILAKFSMDSFVRKYERVFNKEVL